VILRVREVCKNSNMQTYGDKKWLILGKKWAAKIGLLLYQENHYIIYKKHDIKLAVGGFSCSVRDRFP
jgi:hypothetical protein